MTVSVDPTIQEATRRAIHRASGGLQATFTRISGVAPTATETSATVTASVRNYVLDPAEAIQEGFTSSQIGGITQGDRLILVMADELANAGYPLPVQKSDNVSLETGEKMNVTRVDARKRGIAGCIELVAAGV